MQIRISDGILSALEECKLTVSLSIFKTIVCSVSMFMDSNATSLTCIFPSEYFYRNGVTENLLGNRPMPKGKRNNWSKDKSSQVTHSMTFTDSKILFPLENKSLPALF